ncbi:MAG: Lon protease-like protein [Alphaproteobacteria bacterium]|jgi:Lon protease-like protein
MNPFDPSFEDLPGVLPVFPLTGVLLLPRGRLPLNIFEPRYLEMIRDGLAPPRLIGMVQPAQAQAEAEQDDPGLYRTGCAGRITQFEETNDGRLILTIRGVCRFDIVEELEHDRPYRRCAVNWSRYVQDMVDQAGSGFDRARLQAPLRRYFERRDINANWDAIEKLDDDQLITTIAMICPFAASEKQALLEAPGQTKRGELLIAILEMASLGDDDDDATRQ